MKLAVSVLVALAVVASVQATRYWSTPEGDFKGFLDGNDVTGLCGKTKAEAGYFTIQGGKNKNYFYWYFQSKSNPSTDPVILWMTGGPGCSSQLALLFENGPCTVNQDGTATIENPFGWNAQANIIFVDQPAGVGFSYGDAGDEDHNEAMVAEDMYNFLHEFFNAHADLANRALYIFGESYGGHYAPATAHRVGKSLNLQGLGVGNGLTDPLVQYEYYPQMGYDWAKQVLGKPVLTEAQYKLMKFLWPTCQKKIAACQTDTSACPGAQMYCNEVMIAPYEAHGLNPYDIRKPCGPNPLCYDTRNVDKFLNTPSVQRQLGVPPGIKWESCNNTVNAAFSSDWMKNFQQDIPSLLANGTRVLIYAGYICNWIGNKQWTLALDWPGKSAFNNAQDNNWNFNGTTAGVLRSANGFNFLQVHAAGHMVPHDKPEVALHMVNQFVTNSLN
ncbi:serine carboxypeptidase CBP1 [Salpingoeca rosetta]|uniref:Carboxypeptidase n=1 Tax=Salpingoeca rosetta (strain ATCC 50818 / BSB-021) TaxID=946362 RepID=F2UBQ6_SALR5|nr:serine carboxypeptidase CBP1 [Salpingoeca rosetta]EGD73922.1 serine carboxypeptidase CBP1 [Salpingoeca rosetta]|eukprot:XP_004993485.1 serine carboxypeptidase CBP1 [Salpingoeca rosetta]